MPELKMDKNGNITQTGFDQEQGMGQPAAFVQDDDMLKLSMVEKNNVLRDRKALLTMEQLRQAEARRQQAMLKKRMNDLANIRFQELEKQAKIKKQLDYIRNIRGDAMRSLALSQRGQDYEQLSGVSGYGYTNGESGARPYIDFPSRDYQMLEPVQTAFGSFGEALLEKPAPSITDEEEQMIFEWMGDRWMSDPTADPDVFAYDGILRAKFLKSWWKTYKSTHPSPHTTAYPEFEGYKYGYAQIYFRETEHRHTTKWFPVPLAAGIPFTYTTKTVSINGPAWRQTISPTSIPANHPYFKLVESFSKAHDAEMQYLRQIKIQREHGQSVGEYVPMINRIMARQEAAIKRLQEAEAQALEQAALAQRSWWEKLLDWIRRDVTTQYLADHPMLIYELIPRRTPGGMAKELENQMTQNATVTNQGV